MQYYIECKAAHDGGLPQSFSLQVIESNSQSAVETSKDAILNDQGQEISSDFMATFEIESAEPVFSLNNLQPNRQYTFLIYAENSKGRSQQPAKLSNIKIRPKIGENKGMSISI